MSDFPVDDFDEGQSFPGLVPEHMVTQAQPHRLARVGDVTRNAPPPGAKTFEAPNAFQPRKVTGNPIPPNAVPPGPFKTVQEPPQAPAQTPNAKPRAITPPEPHMASQILPEAPRAQVPPPPHVTRGPTVQQRPQAPQTSLKPPRGTEHAYDPFQPPANPLSKYFRLPGLSIRLPTDGVFMPEGSIQFTMTGEVEVFPMRAADELLLKSPDALMSGVAVESLLASCVPSIKYPRLISTPDLDVLLLAIRAASYGHTMDIEVSCPSCQGESVLAVDLRSILGRSNIQLPDNEVKLSDEVTVFIRPYDLNNATLVSRTAFEEARAVQLSESDPTKSQAQVSQSYRRMTDLDIAMTADCVLQVVVPDGAVSDKAMIREFVQNIEREWVRKITDRLKEMNNAGLNKATRVSCAHCHHEWDSKVEFDPSSFFGQNS